MKVWLANLLYGCFSLLLGITVGKFGVRWAESYSTFSWILYFAFLIGWAVLTYMQVKWNSFYDLFTNFKEKRR